MIPSGKFGWLFESGNVEQLTQHLENVQGMADGPLAEMGAQARRHVADNYSKERYLNEMLTLYSMLGVSGLD